MTKLKYWALLPANTRVSLGFSLHCPHEEGKHPKLFIDSPDPYVEILLEVNLNFQVRLTIILANGIFPR